MSSYVVSSYILEQKTIMTTLVTHVFNAHVNYVLGGSSIANLLMQGPLKKWTEHSLELYLLKIHSRGAPITPLGWLGVDFLDHELL